jgi:hypothetical protein
VGCTNVVIGGGSVVATAATSPDAGPPDDPKNVIDNDVCTPWNYGSYGNENAYWQVDLGRAYTLDALTIWPKMTPAQGNVRLLIQYKVNEADAFTPYLGADGMVLQLYDYQPWQAAFDPAISARFFRITIVDTPSFAALREVGLYTGCNRSVKTGMGG